MTISKKLITMALAAVMAVSMAVSAVALVSAQEPQSKVTTPTVVMGEETTESHGLQRPETTSASTQAKAPMPTAVMGEETTESHGLQRLETTSDSTQAKACPYAQTQFCQGGHLFEIEIGGERIGMEYKKCIHGKMGYDKIYTTYVNYTEQCDCCGNTYGRYEKEAFTQNKCIASS